MLESIEIYFYDLKISSSYGIIIRDQLTPFEIDINGVLILYEDMCNALGGRTYYSKK